MKLHENYIQLYKYVECEYTDLCEKGTGTDNYHKDPEFCKTNGTCDCGLYRIKNGEINLYNLLELLNEK